VKVVVLLGLVVHTTVQEDYVLINTAGRGLDASGYDWKDQVLQACRLKWIVTSIARLDTPVQVPWVLLRCVFLRSLIRYSYSRRETALSCPKPFLYTPRRFSNIDETMKPWYRTASFESN
jgi:hypothetical protein